LVDQDGLEFSLEELEVVLDAPTAAPHAGCPQQTMCPEVSSPQAKKPPASTWMKSPVGTSS